MAQIHTLRYIILIKLRRLFYATQIMKKNKIIIIFFFFLNKTIANFSFIYLFIN